MYHHMACTETSKFELFEYASFAVERTVCNGERKLTSQRSNKRADVSKVLGGFLSSGFVHSFASWAVHKGSMEDDFGEARIFICCEILQSCWKSW